MIFIDITLIASHNPRRLHARLMLLKYPDDLLFTETALLHASSLA